MDQGTFNTVFLVVLGLFTGLLSYLFVTTKSSLEEKVKDAKDNLAEEVSECNRKYEKLEAKFHEFENEKYNKIMEVLSSIRSDIAVLKNEIHNLKEK